MKSALWVSLRSLFPDSQKARRAVAAGDEATLGWRPAPGQTIPHRSNWVVREKLGAGGFGEVWLATHEKTGDMHVFKFCFQAEHLRSLRREVMLFRLMKEALGNRDDIARVLDWQFDEPPYFLESEDTAGGNLADWAQGRGGLGQIPLATRLELIAQVAAALAAAHSVGVLHKDIKPTNVLIATDPHGAPKARLTDFGIGLVQDEALLLAKGITVYGLTGIAPESEGSAGTRMYMAPEVIEGKAASVQADIYALGVMLYQAVVGDFGRALAPGWDRDVQDDVLREDVAALVDGSPERRPASAADIAERLRTVERRRTERLEEQRRREDALAAHVALERAQRRRRQFTAIAAVASVVMLVVSVLAIQARRAHSEADVLRSQAEDLISFMLGDLRTKLKPVGRLDVLDEAGKKALAYFAAIPPSAVTDADRMRRSKALSQIAGVRRDQGKLPEALALFQESLTIAQEVTSRHPSVAEWQVALGAGHDSMASVLRQRNDLDGARQHWQTYLGISMALTKRYPDNPNHALDVSYAYGNLGGLRETQRDLQGALQAYQDSRAIKQQVAARDPANPRYQADLAVSHNKIGQVLDRMGDLRGALASYESELAIREALSQRDPLNMDWKTRVATSHSFTGQLLRTMGDADAALVHLQAWQLIAQGLAERDPANSTWQWELAVSSLNVADTMISLGRQGDVARRPDADRAYFERLAAANPSNPSGAFGLASMHRVVGAWKLRLGDPAAAAGAIAAAIAILDARLPKNPDDADLRRRLSDVHNALGEVFAAAGRHADATAAWTKAAQLVEPVARGSSDWRVLAPWARSLLYLGRLQEAAPVVQQLLSSGYRERRFIDLCTQQGLPAGQRPGSGSHQPRD